MAKYRQKFDATAYWAKKPLCTVCKKNKVKIGTICYECKKLIGKITLQSTKEQIKEKTKLEMIKDDSKQTENYSPNDNFGVEVSAEAQNKIVRLFTYLFTPHYQKALLITCN